MTLRRWAICALFLNVIRGVDPVQDATFVGNLSSITYRLDTCGLKGRMGPSFSTCIEFYSKSSNSVLDHLEDSHVDGIQKFVVPKSGLYNITVAGASGGRGICQPSPGLGYVITVSVNLTLGDILTIIVGQEGLSPCAAGNDLPQVCSQNWTDLWENCSEVWSAFANVTVYDDDDDSFLVIYEGGGGGGGASVVNVPGISEPLVVAAGGGGGGSVFDSTFLSDYSENYSFYANASGPSAPLWPNNPPWPNATLGLSGYVNDIDSPVGGEGAGYMADRRSTDQTDGVSLSAPTGPRGGFDCIVDSSQDRTPLVHGSGGFGGGGGGCENGGGGGGYTGGRSGLHWPSYIRWRYIPGEGGYSYIDEWNGILLSEGFNSGDGYVSIVPADCNCIGSCTLDDDKFYCTCPKGSLLAPDGIDCHEEFLPMLEYLDLVVFDNYRLETYSLSGDDNQTAFQSYLVYSMMVSVDIQPLSGDPDTVQGCAILLSNTEDITGISSFILSRDSRHSVNVSLHSLSFSQEENRTVLGNASHFLFAPIRATHLTTVGYRVQCKLLHVLMYTSIQEFDQVPGIPVIEFDDVDTVLRLLLNTTPTSNEGSPPISLIVAVVLSCVIITCLMVISVVLILACIYNRTKYLRKASQYSPEQDNSAVVFSKGRNMSNEATINFYESSDPEYRDYDIIPNFETKYGVSVQEDVDFTAFNRGRSAKDLKEWEYPRESLVYMRELGEGQFGKVHLMKAKNICGHKGPIPVAVKILSNLKPESMKTFYEEMEVMMRFTHSNIVSLLGICSEVEDGAPMIILELMEFGDLKNFLIDNKPSTERSTSLTTEHLYRFAADISNALTFLASEQYVHRDISARNCLVGKGLSVKLSDFGLARAVHDKDYYRVTKGTLLPLRWMAPESIKYGVFTLESDVWSFGVLLWEIASYGQHPHGKIEPNDLITAVEQEKAFLPRPTDCPEKFYDAIRQCQSYSVEKRPKMSQLHLLFRRHVTDSEQFGIENN